MQKYLRFHAKFALLTLIIFIVEVLIARFVTHSFVRGTLGDILVIGLIYCFVQTFFRFDQIKTILCTVLFAFTIEFLQWFKLIHLLHLENNRFFTIILGNTFDWKDLMAYMTGGVILLLTVRKKRR